MASVVSLAFESQFSFSDDVAQLLNLIGCRPACRKDERAGLPSAQVQASPRLRATALSAVGQPDQPDDGSRGGLCSLGSLRTIATLSSKHQNIKLFRALRPLENTKSLNSRRLCWR